MHGPTQIFMCMCNFFKLRTVVTNEACTCKAFIIDGDHFDTKVVKSWIECMLIAQLSIVLPTWD